MANFTAKMIRGSTTSIKDKVLPFFVSCLLWLCWHTLFRHREGTSACCSWFSLCDRPMLAVALRYADRAFSPTRYGLFHSVPFGQRASHCIRECWRYTANMILSQDTFSESVSAFNVSCPLFRLLATLLLHRGGVSACYSCSPLCDRARSPGPTLHEPYPPGSRAFFHRCIAVSSSSAPPELQVTRQKTIPHIGHIDDGSP